MAHASQAKSAVDTSPRHLGAVFLIALIARAGFLYAGPWQDQQRALEPDSPRYVDLAENLRRYHTFGQDDDTQGFVHRAIKRLRQSNGTLPEPDAHGLRPDSFRTPGYPLFVALTETPNGDIRILLAAQCLLGALMASFVVRIVAALGVASRYAVASGVVWAVHPALVLYDTRVMTESLFNVCAVTALLIAARTRSARGQFASGSFLGFAGLVRPLGLLYLPAVIVLACRNGHRTLPIRLRAAAIITLVAVAPSIGWAAHNSAVGEGFRVSSVGDINLLFYQAAYTISEQRGEDWQRSWETRVNELADRLANRLRPGEDVLVAARAMGYSELAARPVMALRVEIKSLIKLAVDHSTGAAVAALGRPYQPTGLFSRLALREHSSVSRPPLAALAIPLLWSGINAAIAVAAAVGLLLAFRRRQWDRIVIGGLTIGLFAAATGAVGLERMRIPIMLPLLLLAAATAQDLEESFTTRWR